jgi:hypothetical protein
MRRSHYIVVIDAAADPTFALAGLGAAVRKIRIDLGIPIVFDEIKLYPRDDEALKKADGKHCAIGQIRYSKVDGPEVEDGVLIYVKPACYGEEPVDIYEYFKRNSSFPHESAGDQFFTESQFESYRMLGAYTMEKICPEPAGDFESFMTQLRNHLASSDSNSPKTPNGSSDL